MKAEEYELTCPEDGMPLRQIDTIRKFGGVGPYMRCDEGHLVFLLAYPADRGMRLRIEVEGP